MRIALFGGGSIGQRHAANAIALGHEITVIETSASARERLRHAVPAARAFGLLGGDEPKPDAVMICTPAITHAAIASSLRDGGYAGPLFVEKPLVTRLKDADVFREWPHQVQAVGYNWRFHPELAGIRDALRYGSTLHLDCRTDIRRWPGAAYADPLLECSHDVDLACYWLGTPTLTVAGEFSSGGAWLQMQHARGDSIVDVRWLDDQPRRRYVAYIGDPRRERSVISAAIDVSPDAEGLRLSYERTLRHFLQSAADYAVTRSVRFGRMCRFDEALRIVEICEHVRERAA